MPNYTISLGAIICTITVEAANAQQALNDVLAQVPEYSIAMIPRMDQRESHWTVENTENSKDKIVIKDTEIARKMVLAVRKDVVDLFWFVSPGEEKKNKTRKIRRQ